MFRLPSPQQQVDFAAALAKARAEGFTECWTVVNVSRLDVAMAHRESPSTIRFYRLGDLLSAQTSEFAEFKDRVIALSGIRG